MRLLCPALVLVLLIASSAGLAEEDDALAKARGHRDRGDFGRAMEVLTDLLEKGDDPQVLIELARTSYLQADEILRSTSPALGQLALLDAIKWAERAASVSPDDPVPHRLLGRVATRASDFDKSIAAWTRVVELKPTEGESHYQLGFALSYRGRFKEGIRAFAEAERHLGPDARVYLNRGISHKSIGEPTAAKAWFLKAIDTEVKGKRFSSDSIRRSWTWLWRIHSDPKRFEAATECFTALAVKYPKLTAPLWYLAHARMAVADHLGAAKALSRLSVISPTWTEGWRLGAEMYARASEFDLAALAAWKLNELDPGGDTPRDLLLDAARGLNRSNRRPEAMALLMKVKGSFPDDPRVLETRGDLYFADGSMDLAIVDYRRTAELDQFADAARAKEQKAVVALLRMGKQIEGPEAFPVDEEPGESTREGGMILDFEQSQVFVRVDGAARGGRENKEFRLTRQGKPGSMANCSLTFVPTLDAGAAEYLVFEVTGQAGRAMNVRMKDGYDEFGMSHPGFIRLAYPRPIVLTGERQTVRIPLERVVPVPGSRTIPLNRARLRSIIFEIGFPLSPQDDMVQEIRIDNVRLQGATEKPEFHLLEDFNNDPEELIFLSAGVAAAFIPSVSSPANVERLRPDPNTFISRAIMGAEYDPATVQAGSGSFRLTLKQKGAASGGLAFNPDRSFDFADALVFWARGTAGGEKIRVTVRDALDDDLGNEFPAQAPRLVAAGTLIEGHFVLSKEWRKFRIPRSAFPDIYFDALAEIRFHFGTAEGNAVGTTMYLDSIGWE